MQLFVNPTSPFARIVRVIVLEKGLADHVTLVWSDPWNHDPALLAAHPLLRIPVLVTEDGHAIAESLLIAQYLDHLSAPPLIPSHHAAQVLARTSEAYGLMEVAFHLVIARKHEGAQADASVMGQRRLAALQRVLQQWEAAPPAPLHTTPAAPLTLDSLGCAVALDYVRFRLPEHVPAAHFPQLHTWLAQALQHPHLAATAFGTGPSAP